MIQIRLVSSFCRPPKGIQISISVFIICYRYHAPWLSWLCFRWCVFIFPLEHPPLGESIVKMFFLGHLKRIQVMMYRHLPGCRYASSWFRREVRRGKGGAKKAMVRRKSLGREVINSEKHPQNRPEKVTISYAFRYHSCKLSINLFLHNWVVGPSCDGLFSSLSGVQHTPMASKHPKRDCFWGLQRAPGDVGKHGTPCDGRYIHNKSSL